MYYLPLDGGISAAARIIELAHMLWFNCSGKEMQGNKSKCTNGFIIVMHKPNLADDYIEGHIIHIIPISDQAQMESAVFFFADILLKLCKLDLNSEMC